MRLYRLASWIVTLDHRNARNPTPRLLSTARKVDVVVDGGKVLWTVLGDCRPEGCGGGEGRDENGRSERRGGEGSTGGGGVSLNSIK